MLMFVRRALVCNPLLTSLANVIRSQQGVLPVILPTLHINLSHHCNTTRQDTLGYFIVPLAVVISNENVHLPLFLDKFPTRC